MDRLIYIAGTGAQQLLQQQAVAAHNLANASTIGFKAESAAFRTAPVIGPGQPTRAYAVDTTVGADMSAGPILETGRDLDVAIQGDGMFAVEARDGTEAYTRDGNFALSAEGQLVNRQGLAVLGDGGPITIPPDSSVTVGRDGTVSVVPGGQSAASLQVVGKLKLVKPEAGGLVKSSDGLFRAKGGQPLDSDPDVAVRAGHLEGSNVNSVAAMVDMINLARNFEMQMKLLQNADGNAQRATQLLAAGGG